MASSERPEPTSFMRIQAVGPPSVVIRVMSMMDRARAGPTAVTAAERMASFCCSAGRPRVVASFRESFRYSTAWIRMMAIMNAAQIHMPRLF